MSSLKGTFNALSTRCRSGVGLAKVQVVLYVAMSYFRRTNEIIKVYASGSSIETNYLLI